MERYIRFKVEAPPNSDYDVQAAYRKLEYMGPVVEGDKIEKKYLRESNKKPWKRYLETSEFLTNRDDNPEEMFAKLSEVTILEDMDKLTYIKKYFTKLFI